MPSSTEQVSDSNGQVLGKGNHKIAQRFGRAGKEPEILALTDLLYSTLSHAPRLHFLLYPLLLVELPVAVVGSVSPPICCPFGLSPLIAEKPRPVEATAVVPVIREFDPRGVPPQNGPPERFSGPHIKQVPVLDNLATAKNGVG